MSAGRDRHSWSCSFEFLQFFVSTPSNVDWVEPVQPGVGPDRDLAKHRPRALARVDSCRALSTDGELRLVLSIEKYLDCILVLAGTRVRLMERRQFIARQVLPCPAAPPNAVILACED